MISALRKTTFFSVATSSLINEFIFSLKKASFLRENLNSFALTYVTRIVLDSSAVEHSAVNRRVVGSNPTRGVKHKVLLECQMTAFKKNNIVFKRFTTTSKNDV